MIILALAFTLVGISAALPAGTPTQLVTAAQATAFNPEDCVGRDLVGECAGLCPASTPEREYFLRGIDEFGQGICGRTYYVSCPYAEGMSPNDPRCADMAPQYQLSDPENINTHGGK